MPDRCGERGGGEKWNETKFWQKNKEGGGSIEGNQKSPPKKLFDFLPLKFVLYLLAHENEIFFGRAAAPFR